MTEFDMSEGAQPTVWEERFEGQINTFFDEAIARVPGFVDRHLRSFRRVMGRNMSPKTGVGDVLVGLRNMASGVSKAVGGPDFETTTFTHDKLVEAFEREVVSPEELESLLARLFAEFEEALWEKAQQELSLSETDEVRLVRERLEAMMERDIAHDPLLAQALRTGVKLGVPATLGYVLMGKFHAGPTFGDAAQEIYKRNLDVYQKVLVKVGQLDVPGWVGAVGWAGGIVGTLALGGVMEFTLNNVRDVKGQYIRQLNAARYALLYGDNPDDADGRGVLHVVRGLERRYDRLPELTSKILESPDNVLEISEHSRK
ncbi:MAG: hypothetical protein R3E66_13030 [bacterium]